MSQAVASNEPPRPASPAEQAFSEALAARSPVNARIRALGQAGREAFTAAGIPDARAEDWKYTSLRALSRRAFAPAGPVALPDEDAVANAAIAGLSGPRLVFVNGRYVPELSDSTPQSGLEVTPLAELCAAQGAPVPDILGELGDPGQHPFTALNLGLLEHGIVLRTTDGAAPEAPVYLLFLSVPGTGPQACHPRILIETAARSSLTVVEHYAATERNENLTNTVTQIGLGPGSHVQHYRIQDESPGGFHIGGLFAQVRRDARLESHNLHFGGALARVDLEVALAEPGAEVDMNGLYCLGGRQHVDNHTRVDHLAPHTRSGEDYRGVLDGRSRGVFNGKAIVHEDAQKIEAHQSNRNLLLSEQAEADTKPELEIYADDVKCSHGATVGQLDATALFYLRSRGIDESASRSLLTFAFAEEVIGRIGLKSVRRRLETAVAGALPDRGLVEDLLGARQ